MTPSRLPEAELEVLACLDRLGGATARVLREELSATRPLAHGSVMTLLKRLEQRGLVSHRKADTGKAFVFEPTDEARATYASVLERLRERIFDGDPVALMASLFETAPPDAGQIAELQALLDRLRDGEEDPRSAPSPPWTGSPPPGSRAGYPRPWRRRCSVCCSG